MGRISRAARINKQLIYASIEREAENARKKPIALAPGKPKYAHKDERDPIDIARAASAALKASS